MVNAKLLAVALGLLIAGTLSAQPPAAGQSSPRQPLASVESRWGDVHCDLTELTRSNPSELTVRYQYRNTRKQNFPLPHTNLVPSTRVFDPVGRTLFGVLKDADGKALSSTMLDGSLARPVPPARTQAHWARLEPPAAGVTAVTVLVEGCLPFEHVTIGGTPAATPLSQPAAAIATQDGEEGGLVVEITRLARSAGGLLDVVVRYRNTGTAEYRFPNAASSSAKRFASIDVTDPATRRKFEVAKDKAGRPLTSESIEPGGGSLGERLAAGQSLNLWAKLAAPGDTTKTVSVYAPLAPPFDNVPISGSGTGATSGGSAVAGNIVGLDAALKDLNAKVTDAEIRIELAADVLFDFDKSNIKAEAAPSLRNVATVLKANPTARVSIEGHTDARGADDYNQKLSESRAASIKQWLIANAQVDGASLATRGWGKSKPAAHNTKPDGSDDPDGRAKNRRVEIVVRKGS